jgi:hypothetical protein
VPDGPQRLRLRVTDAAGNVRTVDPGTVLVHNQPPPVDVPAPVTTPVPPVVAPLVAAPPAVPVAAGGRTFPPNPLAGRGHVPNGTNASERARVTASLELGGRRLRAATVPPGVRVRIRGRVIGRGGRPVAGAALAAVARQSGDIWRPITGVRTRPNGRFTAFTRIGPSRRLRFVYYAYGDSLHGRRSPELRVRVRR